LILAEYPSLPQHGIHQGGFAVVDVRNNGDISQLGHVLSLMVWG
jgi:hypothetical protein